MLARPQKFICLLYAGFLLVFLCFWFTAIYIAFSSFCFTAMSTSFKIVVLKLFACQIKQVRSNHITANIQAGNGYLNKYVKGQKKKNFYFFSIPEDSKLTSKLFFGNLHWDIFFLFFCICVGIYLFNPRMESKRYLVNKNPAKGRQSISRPMRIVAPIL